MPNADSASSAMTNAAVRRRELMDRGRPDPSQRASADLRYILNALTRQVNVQATDR
jgi:hypothetical protein